MESGSGLYEDVVSVYLRLIKQESPQAAAAIKEILITCDSRAALRATLVITLLKIEVQEHHAIPDTMIYSDMLRGYPQALPLVELAIKHWLHDWSIRDAKLRNGQNNRLPGADAEASLPTTDLPPSLEE